MESNFNKRDHDTLLHIIELTQQLIYEISSYVIISQLKRILKRH